jgi:hypothetical protein
MGISQQIGASSMVKWGVCTSSTRPASPYAGQHIYETDTNLQFVWNGSAWINNYASTASPTFTGTVTIPAGASISGFAPLASPALTGTPTAPTATAGTNTTQIATMASKPWNIPWGVVSFTESATPPANFTSEAVMITGASFTAFANRYYKVTYFEPDPASVSATSWLACRIRVTNLAGTLKQQGYVQLPTAGVSNSMMSVIWVGTLSSGTTNFVGTLQSASGTGGVDRSSIMKAFIIVEDLGPA